MSDVPCAVCGEPWDAYGLRHGDVLAWEYQLFRAAAGCPCCEGVPEDEDADPFELLEAHVRCRIIDVPFDDDPDPSALLEEDYKAPAWERPEGVPLWTCTGCEVEVRIDPDDGESLEWYDGESVHYYRGHAFHYGQLSHHDEPTREPPHTVADEPYCPGCAQACDECSEAVIFRRSELDLGGWAEGASHPHPNNMRASVCSVCAEALDEGGDGD